MPVGRVTLARFARVRLLRHALPISVLQSKVNRTCTTNARNYKLNMTSTFKKRFSKKEDSVKQSYESIARINDNSKESIITGGGWGKSSIR